MSQKVIVFAALLSVAIGLAAYISFSARKTAPIPAAPQPEQLSSDLPVRLESMPNELSLPATVKGEARGYWYFEAQFPVQIISESGALVATGIATADGEWMTEDYVPFTVVLKGSVSERTSATIIFKKDNPSGLPENDDAVSFPVFIIPSSVPESVSVKAFFSYGDGSDCSAVRPIDRAVPKTTEVAKAALLELLKGPGNEPGITTNINPETGLNKITIRDGVAYADFNSGLNRNIGGSCRVAAIRAQITETLKQFPTVKDVVISVNGETEAILEP